MTDLGQGPGGQGPPLLWVKKEEMIEGRKQGKAGSVTAFEIRIKTSANNVLHETRLRVVGFCS